VLRAGDATFEFFHGDCLEVLPHLQAGSIQTIVTSPPYNLGIAYNTYDDRLPQAEYLAWTAQWVQQAARLLGPDGSLFLNVGSKPTDPWTAFDVAQAVRPFLRLQNTLHWIKSIAIDAEAAGAGAALDRCLAVGHYKPINSPRFVNDAHEFIFHFTPDGRTPLDRLALGVPYQDESNVTRWRHAGGGLRCRGNTWFLPYDTIKDRAKDRPHPATFPPRLPEFCVRLHGRSRVHAVADPFTGLGSTAVACALLGVSFVGVEMDEGYLTEAIERTRAALAEQADGAAGARRAAPSAPEGEPGLALLWETDALTETSRGRAAGAASTPGETTRRGRRERS
jgi:site-specific DNA-methyltransferase (adenine-specific)